MAVLDALPALLQAYPGLRYDIVGDGDGRSDLERVVAERGLQASVCFHGFIPEDELDRLYAEAGVFVLPSTGEGFGLVFLEAMARGLAVVAARASAVPEIVIDGETGYLVDPARPGELERAVRTLLADEDLRRTMGEAGRARVQSTFNCDVFRHRLAEHLCALGVRVAG
jgi:phosphatidylinositol alpha-1,6-mannosyltransferase